MDVDVEVQAVLPFPREVVAAYAGDPSHAPEWYVNIEPFAGRHRRRSLSDHGWTSRPGSWAAGSPKDLARLAERLQPG